MIDIHTHILHHVDDGSKNLKMSLEMVELSYRRGVEALAVTPHCMPGVYGNIANDYLHEKWRILYNAVKEAGIPVHLRKGMEVLISDRSMNLIHERKIWTLNNSDYLLVEFVFDEDPIWCAEKLKEVRKEGYIPIIAHPERYYFVQNDPQIVYDWHQKGYGIQLNQESLLGMFGKKEKNTADSLLRHNVVTCVASDCHRPDRREPGMKEVYSYLNNHYGNEYAHMLVDSNPLRILNNRDMVGYKPISYEHDW